MKSAQAFIDDVQYLLAPLIVGAFTSIALRPRAAFAEERLEKELVFNPANLWRVANTKNLSATSENRYTMTRRLRYRLQHEYRQHHPPPQMTAISLRDNQQSLTSVGRLPQID